VISGAKLEQVITSLGEGLTNSEVEGIFADIKLDEDGNVNYAELAELLNSGPTAVSLGTRATKRPLRARQGDNVILESQGWSEPEVTRHPERGARKDRLASISTVATDPSVVHEPTEAESMALRK
ncbi:hypothetical protein FOZ62_014265, partial [Perkinsus olseni]